ncbi:MAG: hypothetical protein Q7S33_05510 [Nanoarchaeota archaeon]|nr:hypothetical protein [Nanoarchaeota archaeon]
MVDTIYLKADELKLFKFLKSRSSDSSLWPSLEEIQKNLELSKPNARKLVKSLREKEGIEICSSVGGFGKNKKVSYGLSPEDLDILVTIDNAQQNNEKQKPNEVYSALYLAEPAFGTKAFDDKYTMKGLALFLETNKFSPDLQEVIIQGGVIPHIPPYYSKGYANDLKFLGKIKRNGERTSLSETLLEDRIENEFERNFYVKHINDPERKKITNLTDAFSAAEEQISILMNTLPEDSVLRIQFGEEDRKNIEHLEVAQIKNWAKEKAEQIEGMSKELKEEVEELYNNSFSTIVQKHYLASYLQNPKLVKKSNEKRADYYKRAGEFFKEDKLMSEISNFWKDFGKFVSNDKEEQEGLIEEDSNDLLKDAVEDAVKYVFWAGKNPEKIKQKFEKVNNDFSNLEIEKRNLKSKLDDLSNSFTWTDSLLNSGSVDVTWFTKQYPVFADELEFGFKKVKDKYSGHFFKWKIGQPVVVHVSPRKNVKIDTGIIENLSNGEKSIAEIDYEIVSNGKKNILLVHNLNHIFSDNVSPSTIKDAKLEMNYENIVLNKLFEEEFKGKTPDIVLLGGHHSGGFRVMPWFKKSEQLIE